MLSILNNISSLQAQNALNTTQASLNSTLQQLSTGQRIDTGADDPAGLAIANGLEANITALTQSSMNATDGVGMLQTADGALSQVTTLLNQAVTLATEAATGTVSSAQRGSLDAEYQAIQSEITQIGSSTNYNGTSVFNASENIFLSDGVTNSSITAATSSLSASGILGATSGATLTGKANATATDAVVIGGTTYTFVAGPLAGAAKSGASATAINVVIGSSLQATMQNLADAINGNSSDEGVAYQAGGGANADAVASASGTSISLSATPLGATLASIASTTTDADFGFLNGTTFTAGTSSNLLTSASATSALSAINAAIATVANERGAMGAVVNRLNAASGVESTQQTNLSSAESGIMDADMAQVTSNMSKYTILQQTGIAALQQSQQMSQSVLKLLQNIA